MCGGKRLSLLIHCSDRFGCQIGGLGAKIGLQEGRSCGGKDEAPPKEGDVE